MDAAFALVVRKSGGPSAPELSLSPTATAIGFAPRHRLDWSDASGAVSLVAWHDASARSEGGWYEQSGRLGFVVGNLRWREQAWAPSTRWAQDLTAAAPSRSLDVLRDDLRGVFAAGHLTSEGDGWVLADVLGLRLLYWGEDDDRIVVSSRAALAAHALAAPGVTPPRDAEGACWLAFTGYRVGDRSGYEEVRIVPPGAQLHLERGRPRWEATDPLIVAPDDELRASDSTGLAELVQHDVAGSLRAALSHPADRHILRLTGGKDSRLVLAIAHRAGLAEAFSYETVGPPELADVQIATELCSELGLRHEAKFLGLESPVPYAERFDDFVEATGCMVNGWEMAASTHTNDLRMTGLCGELMRTYWKVPETQWSTDRIAGAFPRSSMGRLGLLRDDLGDALHRDLLTALAEEPSREADPLDRVQALFAGTRMRFARMGAREELSGDHPMLPLYSRATVRAAMAMDSRDRQSEVLFAEVMRRSSDLFVRHRFTDAGWDDRAKAHLGLITEPSPQPARTKRGGKPPSLVESLHAVGKPDRHEMLVEVLADSTNPAWDRIDRPAALEALGRYAELTTRERYELFGAATAAVWLAR